MTHELILHIGANKTGSSAIQRFIQANRTLLGQLGFHVPDQHLGWSNAVTGAHVFAFQKMFNESDAVEQVAARFDALAAGSPEGRILISAENLSNLRNAAHLSKVCSNYETKVIIYIRRQDDLLSSSWQQWYSKKGSDMTAWLFNAMRSIGHWEQTIREWENVAGKGAVTVRLFERETFPNGDIANDFLETLGLSSQDGAFDFSTEAVNPSYSEFITPLVAGNSSIFENVHDNTFYNVVGKLTGEHYAKGKKYSLLTHEQRSTINAHYEAQNERIRARFFPQRKRLFKTVEQSRFVYASREELVNEQLRFLTHMVFELAKRAKL